MRVAKRYIGKMLPIPPPISIWPTIYEHDVELIDWAHKCQTNWIFDATHEDDSQLSDRERRFKQWAIDSWTMKPYETEPTFFSKLQSCLDPTIPYKKTIFTLAVLSLGFLPPYNLLRLSLLDNGIFSKPWRPITPVLFRIFSNRSWLDILFCSQKTSHYSSTFRTPSVYASQPIGSPIGKRPQHLPTWSYHNFSLFWSNPVSYSTPRIFPTAIARSVSFLSALSIYTLWSLLYY